MAGADRGFLALLRDKGGNVLPLAAVGMLVSAALVGGSIDMSRAYRVKNRLQSACDAAALAGRRAVTTSGFDTNAEDQAKNFFTANFNDSSLETTGTIKGFTSPDNGNTVVGTASTNLNLAVMKIFGFQRFTLAVDCQASMGVGNSDVVMVLDTTGSMTKTLGSGTRISALQAAMKNFYTTVKNATAGSNARIRYGFVPYSSTVNVGKLLYAKNPAWLVDTWQIHSRQPVATVTTENKSVTTSGSTKSYGNSSGYSSSGDCTAALPEFGSDNGSATTDPRTYEYDDGDEGRRDDPDGFHAWTDVVKQPMKGKYYECYKSGSKWYARYYDSNNSTWTRVTTTRYQMVYKRVTYDVSSYKKFQSVSTNTGDFGEAVSSTWAGCIEERGTTNSSTFTFSTTTGLITPTAARDLDIDSAPTSDDATKWRPMWPEVAYRRITDSNKETNTDPSNYGVKAKSYCPYEAQLLTVMTQDEFNAYADALKAEGSTYLDIGMTWGGRLSSPDGLFKDNVILAPTNGGEVSRHIIFMTDGLMEPNNDIQSAWGIEYHDRRVTSDGSSNDASRHTSRFLAVCAAIRAKGIRIWTISFTTGTNADLTSCASPNSSYNADDAAQLDSVFQQIAKQVGELRLTQ